jgi:hypothetical protein
MDTHILVTVMEIVIMYLHVWWLMDKIPVFSVYFQIPLPYKCCLCSRARR